ncbi:MAG: hypothetical protein Ct9H300mP27_08120 [Chloroflexota bacterium]|nr:MAG: hypothetical protein Ct9H300mP27_08120 [Chloroflexota bacterium]
MFQIVNKEMATNTYHWFFLIQPYDFPERVIGADPIISSGHDSNELIMLQQCFPLKPLKNMSDVFPNLGQFMVPVKITEQARA